MQYEGYRARLTRKKEKVRRDMKRLNALQAGAKPSLLEWVIAKFWSMF